jgi:hypothetical protein
MDWRFCGAFGTFLLLVILLLIWQIQYVLKKKEPEIFSPAEEVILTRQRRALQIFFIALGIFILSIWLHLPVRDSWIGWGFFIIACVTLGYIGLSALISNVFWSQGYSPSRPHKGDGAKITGCTTLIVLGVITLDWWLQLLTLLARK